MTMGTLAGFRPSNNGLHYGNDWPSEPDLQLSTPFGPIPIGNASNGLCGGMAFAVRDLVDAGRQPPAETGHPPGDSAAFNYIVGRLFDSFNLPSGVLEYYTWMNLPTHNTLFGPKGTSDLTINSTMPILRRTIDSNHPCPLGLVCVHTSDPTMLGHNHQVLAWGYEDSGAETTVRLYDPNWPNRDDVTISFNHTNPAHTTTFDYSTGDHTVLGFFACTWFGAHDPSPLFSQDPPPPPPSPPPVLRTSCQPDSIPLNRPVTFEVTATDPRTSKPVSGSVLVSGVRVGNVGAPIRHTFVARFRPSRPVSPGRPRNGGGEDGFAPPVVMVEATGYAFSPVAVTFDN